MIPECKKRQRKSPNLISRRTTTPYIMPCEYITYNESLVTPLYETELTHEACIYGTNGVRKTSPSIGKTKWRILLSQAQPLAEVGTVQHPNNLNCSKYQQTDGLVQECNNSSVLEMGLPKSYAKPLNHNKFFCDVAKWFICHFSFKSSICCKNTADHVIQSDLRGSPK